MGVILNSENVRDVETLPLSETQVEESKKMQAQAACCIAVWLVMSSAVVIFNKWVFTKGGFPYPLALVSMHMTSCFIVFGSIRRFAADNLRLSVMPDADVQVLWPAYAKNFLGISIFYACTLGAGNMAYMYSSVAFIQMMKPMNIIWASLAAFVVGVEVPSYSHFIIVCVIALGVLTATDHAVDFSMTGCLLQVFSSLSEGSRLALVQGVTAGGLKLDPVTTVYHFSGASAVLLWCACFMHEYPLDLSKLLSPWVLVINCAMAVVLNVLVAVVIKKTSAVIFALSGIVKDIGIVGVSSFVFVTPVTPMMICGYSISVCGLFMFKAYKDNLRFFKEEGFLAGMKHAARQATEPQTKLASQ